MRKKMIIKIISWIIFIGLVIALIVGAINIYMVTTTSKRIISVDDAKDINADCIIVLGAGVKPSGKPSWMLEDRIIVGEQLYNVNAAPKLLMSGDHGRENYDEVNTMKNYALMTAYLQKIFLWIMPVLKHTIQCTEQRKYSVLRK